MYDGGVSDVPNAFVLQSLKPGLVSWLVSVDPIGVSIQLECHLWAQGRCSGIPLSRWSVPHKYFIWCLFGGFIMSGVMCIFCERKVITPVVLPLVNPEAEILFKPLIFAL